MKVMKNGKEWTTDSINARAILGERARNVFEAYDNEKAYVLNNKVAYEGSSYVNILACTGVLPTDPTHWLVIAAKGEDGIIGVDGLSAYQSAVNNGYVGTEAEWIAGLSLVPTDLVGYAGKALTVNQTEDGLVFADVVGGGGPQTGAALLTGTADPTNDIGEDGDVYIKYY